MTIYSTSFSKVAFILLVFLLPDFAFSSTLLLSPNNLTEILNEIQYRHGGEIDLPMGKVKSFLEQNISGDFAANLLPPQAEISDVDDEKIVFSWSAIANADAYSIRYLNLEDGDFDDILTSNLQAQFDIENHLFLFTFQSISDEGKGPSWIIIQDKPLTLTDFFRGCKCKRTGETTSFGISTLQQELFPYPDNGFNETFVVSAEYYGENGDLLNASFPFKVVGTDGEVDNIFVVQDDACSPNVRSDGSYIYAIEPESDFGSTDDTYAIQFSFGSGGVNFKALASQYTGGSLVLNHCTSQFNNIKKRPSLVPSPPLGNISPNPTSGQFTFKIEDSTDGEILLLLKNAMGEIVQKIIQPNAPTQSIDLSAYPNGLYYLQVVSEMQNETHPIVKMD